MQNLNYSDFLWKQQTILKFNTKQTCDVEGNYARKK